MHVDRDYFVKEKRAMNCGRAGELSSSRGRFPSMARFAATSAILTVTSSKLDRAPIRSTV